MTMCANGFSFVVALRVLRRRSILRVPHSIGWHQDCVEQHAFWTIECIFVKRESEFPETAKRKWLPVKITRLIWMSVAGKKPPGFHLTLKTSKKQILLLPWNLCFSSMGNSLVWFWFKQSWNLLLKKIWGTFERTKRMMTVACQLDENLNCEEVCWCATILCLSFLVRR